MNPLPEALAHYQREAEDVLRATGATVSTLPVPTIEVGRAGKDAKASAAVASLMAHRRVLRDIPPGDRVLVLWPAFGHLEALTWPSGPVWPLVSVMVHDPAPLRRQRGLSERSAVWGAKGAARIETISLSDPADAVLDTLGWPARTRLPIHMRAPVAHVPQVRDTVAILGQFKPVRDMEAVRVLGAEHNPAYRYLIAGRGWPTINGWELDNRFVPDNELDGMFDRAAAVVVPYREFFQSGVAVRALERLAPVVAPEHPMIAELLGADWPGIVRDQNDWSAALDRALAIPQERIVDARDRYWHVTVKAWSNWAQGAVQ